MATKKAVERSTRKAGTGTAGAKSMPAGGRNPEGGLTAKGRAFFAERDGSKLKAGVTGAADTPEKMKRKGSFLVRTFTHPRGPMQDDKGDPTRLALSAHAWGEKVPGNDVAAHKLAQKGHRLLEQYHRAMGDAPRAKRAANGTPAKKTAAKTSVTKAVPASTRTRKA